MTESAPLSNSEWLTLGQAARRLGVHATTLRRWAEQGEVPFLVTPGGHRRFTAADLDSFAGERRHLIQESHIEETFARTAMAHVRQGIAQHPNERWLAAFRGADRDEGRQLGRQLMTVAMHFIADPDSDEPLLEEARSIGERQAEAALAHGLSLTEVMQAVLFYRDTLLEVAMDQPDVTRRNPVASTQLIRRLGTLLNVVQLAVARTYERRLTLRAP